MTGKHIGILFFVLLIGCGAFYLDFMGYKDLHGKDQIEDYKTGQYDLLGIVQIPKNLINDGSIQFDEFIKKDSVDIPIQKLLFYQKEYGKIPNITCDNYQNLKLQRNYIVEPTFEDKANMLKSKDKKEEKIEKQEKN